MVYLKFIAKIVIVEALVFLATGAYCWYEGDISLSNFAIVLSYAGLITIAIGGIALVGSGGGMGMGGRSTSGMIPVSSSAINQDIKDRPSRIRFAAIFVIPGILAAVASEIFLRFF
jgi:hypothetical protein